MPSRPGAFVAVSRAINVLTGGRAGEMFCSRAYRRGWWLVTTPCDAVFMAFFDEEDHCYVCWEHDFARGVAGPLCRNL